MGKRTTYATYKKGRRHRYHRGIGERRAAARAISRRQQRFASGIGIEKKVQDKTLALTALTATWAGGELDPAGASSLCAPSQGNTAATRDGNDYVIKTVQLNGRIIRPPQSDVADVTVPTTVKLALVLDTQSNGTQLSAENVYSDDTGAAGDKVYGYRETEYTRRFQVLWTKIFNVGDTVTMTDGANTASTAGSVRYFKIYLNLDIPVHCNGNAGTIADCTDNSLHFIGCATDTNASVEYVSRVRFVG